jgi:ketosteroid isomerase-like protein
MKQKTLFGLAASVLLWTAGCTQAPPPVIDTRDADIKAIKDADAAEAKDMADKAFDKMVSYYADNATLYTPGAPAAVGKPAIEALSKTLRDIDLELKFSSGKVDVAKNGDLGYVQGTYTETAMDPKTKRRSMEKGNYVTIYKRQTDGGWKIIEDINTPDSAPTPVVKIKTGMKKAGKGKKKAPVKD